MGRANVNTKTMGQVYEYGIMCTRTGEYVSVGESVCVGVSPLIPHCFAGKIASCSEVIVQASAGDYPSA